MILNKPISACKLLRSNLITISEPDLIVWSLILCNEFKQLLIRNSKLNMIRVEVAAITIIEGMTFTKVDDPSQHLCYLTIAENHKKAFRFSAVVIIVNEDRSKNHITLNQKQVQANQGLDMNIVFIKLSYYLSLKLIFFSKVRFLGMLMCTTDNKKIALQHIVKVYPQR